MLWTSYIVGTCGKIKPVLHSRRLRRFERRRASINNQDKRDMANAIFLCLLLFVSTSLASPLGRNDSSVRRFKVPSTESYHFMQRFGYLESAVDSEAIYTEDAVVEAIKNVQRFGAIPQTGIVDEATIKLMKSRRCGVPDIIKDNHSEGHRSKRYVLAPSRWKKRNITYFVSNWSPKLGEAVVADNIQRALNEWGKYGHLSFTRSDLPVADIIVKFTTGNHGDNFPFDGPGSVLAHAFFPNSGLGGDIHFDEDENWTVHTAEDQEGTDFFTVAIHELGHSLGLSHSDVESSIMFPYYKGFTPQLSLDYDDILAMYEYYIRRFNEDEDKPPKRRRTTTSTTSTTTTTTTTTTERPTYTTTTWTRPTAPRTNRPVYWTTQTTRPPWTTTRQRYPPTRHNWHNHHPTTHKVIYEGDFETVEKHQEHQRRMTPPPVPKTTERTDGIPDVCTGNFDAIANLRGELFVFKQGYIWRLRRWQELESGYPIPIHQMFPGLPESVKRVDAVYERPTDHMFVLFTGSTYWVSDGQSFIEGSPRPITDYGLPAQLDSIDAIQVWGKNHKTYIYKNDVFWRYNETTRSMDKGYPRHMEIWGRIPTNIDAAITWRDITYFFKGELFWRFDNNWLSAHESSPLPMPQIWLGCPERENIYYE